MIRISLLALVVLAAACTSNPTTPGPTPTPTPNPVALGTVTGLVTHSDGQPVAGAAITVVVNATSKSATSGADGRYTVAEVPLGAGTLTITAANFHTHTGSVTVTQSTAVNVALTPLSQPPPPPPVPTATVQGTVISQTTTLPIEDADIDLVITSEQRFKTTTDALGKFTLTGVPIGVRAELRIDAAGHVSSTQTIEIAGDLTVSVPLPVVATPTPTPTPPSGFTTALRLLDAFTRGGLGGAVLTGSGLLAAASSDDGRTLVSSDTSESSPRRVSISRPGYVTRETFLRVPGDDADLDLIPASELADFDALARADGQIARWTRALPLIVNRRVVLVIGSDYGTGYESTLQVPETEVDGIKQDMREHLSGLTGGTINAFAGELNGNLRSGRLAVSGHLAVYRVADLGLENGWYGATSVELDGNEIVGGVILLDEQYDRTAPTDERYRVRGHELGHAVGFNHVTRQSIMSIIPGLSVQLSAWDRDAMGAAFLRKPGNRSPDQDPHDSASPNSAGRRWTPFIGHIKR